MKRTSAPALRRVAPRPAAELVAVEVLECRRLFAAGSLDPTFGTGGLAYGGAGEGGASASWNITDVATQPDGKIYLAGYPSSGPSAPVLYRYTSAGAPDASYGVPGDPAGERPLFQEAAFPQTGKLLVLGNGNVLITQSVPDPFPSNGYAFDDYNVDRSLDANAYADRFYGAPPAIDDSSADVRALARQSDGKVVVAAAVQFVAGSQAGQQAWDVFRLNANGSVDPTFHDALFPIPSPNGFGSLPSAPAKVAVAPDGSIVVAGSASYYHVPANTQSDDHFLTVYGVVAKIRPAGGLDPSFGGTGIEVTRLSVEDNDIPHAPQDDDGFNSVFALPGGDIAAWGNAGDHGEMVRYSPTGSAAVLAVSPTMTGLATVQQADGKWDVVGRTAYDPSGTFQYLRAAVARYNADGTLDATFATGGTAVLNLNPAKSGGTPVGNSLFTAAALEPDGRLVAVGETDATDPNGSRFVLARFTTDATPPPPFATLSSAGALTITGTPGDDALTVGLGNGQIVATLNGVAEKFDAAKVKSVTASLLGGNDKVGVTLSMGVSVRGGAGNDTISGGSGNDTVDGGDGNDLLLGQGGNDSLAGSAGNDYLVGGAGSDTISGGAGIDWVSYSDHTSGVNVSLDGVANDGSAGEADDVLPDVENVNGSPFNDLIIGSAAGNNLVGGAGNDTIFGLGGNDTLRGGDGNDSLDGGSGRDFIAGDAGNDTVHARDGEVDTIDGGAGTDSAQVDNASTIKDVVTNVEVLLA